MSKFEWDGKEIEPAEWLARTLQKNNRLGIQSSISNVQLYIDHDEQAQRKLIDVIYSI